MDEIVFQRETVKRALQGLLILIEQADKTYDPAEDVPAADYAAMIALMGLAPTAQGYMTAVTDRFSSVTVSGKPSRCARSANAIAASSVPPQVRKSLAVNSSPRFAFTYSFRRALVRLHRPFPFER